MTQGSEREDRRLVQKALADRTGLVTLAAGSTATTISDARIRFDSPMVLVPVTASAAAELGAGTLYIGEAGRANGSVVITHASGPLTDRTFRYFVG